MIALALIALLAFGLISQGSASIAVGDSAPSAELPRLDGSGTGSVGEHRGGWVLVNFWASWCSPCRDESPTLQRFYERNRDDVAVLGIDTQDLSDDAADFSDEYGATGLPESFLVDPDGRLAAICRGPLTPHDLEEVIAPLVGGHDVTAPNDRSEEHTSELQSRENLVCRLLLEKKKKTEMCWCGVVGKIVTRCG